MRGFLLAGLGKFCLTWIWSPRKGPVNENSEMVEISEIFELNDVYRMFGEAAEAAQLLETELGTMLLGAAVLEEDLVLKPDPKRAREIYDVIDRKTLGQLVRGFKEKGNATAENADKLESLLWTAVEERNRLQHSFFRQHNFRRNSNEGRAIMIKDLESIHDKILDAYKALMLLSGVDLDDPDRQRTALPTRHLPI